MKVNWSYGMMAKVRLALVGLLVAAVTLTLAWLTPLMAPVKDGTSADFWEAACRVTIGEQKDRRLLTVHRWKDGWFVYGVLAIHQEFLYRVSESEVLADFPAVVEKLDSAPEGNHIPKHVLAGYKAWSQTPARQQGGAAALLASIREARLDQLRERDADLYELVVAEERAFDDRWEQTTRYWVNVIFEFGFFVGLIVFTVWPWLRWTGRAWWSARVGAFPLLLFLPYFLGYGSYTFTSAGPSGGILYPWVIWWCYRPVPSFLEEDLWTCADPWILEHLPKVLEPLSQPLGSWMALSGGYVGPLFICILAAMFSAVTFGALSLMRRNGS